MGTIKTLDISPVGRVEGDLDIRVSIDDGVVVDAWASAEMFRGFEVILQGKDPQAGLIVTPRICGICGASHLTCGAWALDTAWETEVPRNAILARNLGQICESLQSIPRHHFAMFTLDMINPKYSSSRFYEEAVHRWSAHVGRSYEEAIHISAKPVEIYAIFGGQWPHSSYMVPGGVMCAPVLTDITRSYALLDFFRSEWIEPRLLGCKLERYEQIQTLDDFNVWLEESPKHAESELGLWWRMGLDIGLQKFGAGVGRFLSWGYLPHEDRYQRPTIEGRADALIMQSAIYDGIEGVHETLDQVDARESTPHSWYDEPDGQIHPFDRQTRPSEQNERDFEGRYSWATTVRHAQHGPLEAGPLARQLVAGRKSDKPWQHHDPLVLDMFRNFGGASVFLRHFARLHEVVKLYRQARRCVEQMNLSDPWYIKPVEKDGRGFGATEAARGALSHWIDVRDGKIHNYQVIAPTTWNVGPRDAQSVQGPIEKALIGTEIHDTSDPVEVGQVARSFDSCMVCTVHAVDARTGKDLARFRVS